MANEYFIEDGVWVVIREDGYDIAILCGDGGFAALNPVDDNVDVEVRMSDGKFYTGTFFTIENIRTLLGKTKVVNNESCFYTKFMIIVEALSIEQIRASVKQLFLKHEIDEAFELHSP